MLAVAGYFAYYPCRLELFPIQQIYLACKRVKVTNEFWNPKATVAVVLNL